MASRRRVDESDEDEATAIDLRSSQSGQKGRARAEGASLPSASGAGARPAAPHRPAPRKSAPIVDDDDDEDATEFLSVRPPPRAPASPASAAPAASSGGGRGRPADAPRARGRAVPLGGGAEDERSTPGTPTSTASSERAVDRVLLAGGGEGSVDALPRSPRPLPSRHASHEDSTTNTGPGTASVPRITRIHVVSETADVDDSTEPRSPALDPRPSPAPSPAPPRRDGTSHEPGEPARVRKASTVVQSVDDETLAPSDPDATQASSTGDVKVPSPCPVPSTADEAAQDGTLVIEAPAEATIIVNGVERGRGHVRVCDLDRHARHAVRIHCPGHLPWSGSVTLEGKPAAKIRPTLKPRAR